MAGDHTDGRRLQLLVVGQRRSGLSLVRAMLDSHPDVALAPPSPLGDALAVRSGTRFDAREFLDAVYADLAVPRWGVDRKSVERSFVEDGVADGAEAVERVLELWAGWRGKRVIGAVVTDQTAQLATLAARWPDARFVHVVRDGRDVAASLMEMGWVETIERAALDWRRLVRRARQAGRRLESGRYHEVRYEDLVHEPDVTLRLLSQALDLRFHRAMLDHRPNAAAMLKALGRPHENRFLARPLMPGLRDWRRDLPASAIDRFEALAGDVLAELGYDLRNRRPSLRAHLATRRQWLRWHRGKLR